MNRTMDELAVELADMPDIGVELNWRSLGNSRGLFSTTGSGSSIVVVEVISGVGCGFLLNGEKPLGVLVLVVMVSACGVWL